MNHMADKLTKDEATRAAATTARAVLAAHEAAFNAGHGVGTARHARIALQVALLDLEKAEGDGP